MEYKKYPERIYRHFSSIPFIYFMIIPIFFLDICLETYHQICFRLYGLPLVEREKYIKIDRHRLSYLIWYEKINCAYCGYANGVAQYFCAIAAATEKYWCGIKHERDQNFISPQHHKNFIGYGDEKAYRNLPR